ncbi:oxygenase MpaB family protein [Mycobacteroides chelonae]|uniref:oxygenase MpaB family protein n=1 Tax=Mycobacteroides chelonae TaxID=1774 RepID=UPI0009928A15|nr:oxygenase MpaB family protein [Mycobacteroides chelonae]
MPELTVVDKPLSGDPHPFDYYFRPGMDLRPIPEGKNEFGWIWRHCRHYLFDPWFDVEDEVTPTPATRLFDDHMWQGDEPMDAVAELFHELGSAQARALFEQAVEHGVDSLDDPPEALRALFADAYRVPPWWDPAKAERGRLRARQVTTATTAVMATFAVFDTVMNSDVSAATGATGRFRYQSAQRLAETNRFFSMIFDRDGLVPGSEQIKLTMRVRLVHALARRGLRSAWGEDNFAEYGAPISNASMCGFIEAMLGALLVDYRLGRSCTLREIDDVWHYLLRWALMFGVTEDLLPRTGIDAMRNLDYLLARSGDASRWRVELIEALATGISGARTGPVRRIFAEVLAGPGSMLMGPAAMDEFFQGTTFEGINHRLSGWLFSTAAAVNANASAVFDRLPGIGLMRRQLDAFNPNPSAVNNLFSELIEKRARVASTYTMHDNNTSGHAFAR